MSTVSVTDALWGAHAPKGINALLSALVRAGLSRGLVRRGVQAWWKKADGAAFDVDYHGLKLRLFPDDNVTDKKILFRSGRRDERYLAPLLRHAGPGAVIADIGANVGYYGCSALRHGYGRLIAVEPSPALLPRLRFHLAANGFGERAHVAPVAVADQAGELFLHCPGTRGGASVSATRLAEDDVRVPVKTLAQVLAEAGDPVVTTFKIDIEGHEDRALLPWLRALPDERLPRCGLVEICHARLWREDVIGYLFSRGYREVLRDKSNLIVERAD